MRKKYESLISIIKKEDVNRAFIQNYYSFYQNVTKFFPKEKILQMLITMGNFLKNALIFWII